MKFKEYLTKFHEAVDPDLQNVQRLENLRKEIESNKKEMLDIQSKMEKIYDMDFSNPNFKNKWALLEPLTNKLTDLHYDTQKLIILHNKK